MPQPQVSVTNAGAKRELAVEMQVQKRPVILLKLGMQPVAFAAICRISPRQSELYKIGENVQVALFGRKWQ
ncbi:MAG: hypothetical protein JO316_15665 [Abitibacteriaceae bacterium]|nr:hypothetical protein [Abditibacteriaceae bacterium]MBV9866792.1 hypothetical protein [Abditibacteriaceae bacterium]